MYVEVDHDSRCVCVSSSDLVFSDLYRLDVRKVS